jgi:hypothetical protein
MHVYTFAPETLEITSVTTHFFEDVDACKMAVGAALRAATSRASVGDLVDAQCVAMDPPDGIAQSKATHMPVEVTEL